MVYGGDVQASQVEMHPITGEGRLKMCMDQQRDAAVELQMHVRRLLANNPDERLERRGYARVLTATELLHAQLRRVRVRNLIRNLMEMYGIMTLQAIVRRNKVRKGYGRQLDSASCLVYASRRSLVTHSLCEPSDLNVPEAVHSDLRSKKLNHY